MEINTTYVADVIYIYLYTTLYLQAHTKYKYKYGKRNEPSPDLY